MEILVKKQDGNLEVFDKEKLVASVKKNGGSPEVIDKVCDYLEKEQVVKISSDKIYSLTQKFLLKEGQKHAFLRYNLPQAVYKLGPEGFAFEKFIAEVFESYQYKPVYVGKRLQGKCVLHELDVIAYKGNELMTAELKFHNSRSKKTDLHVALYMKARFDDILAGGYYGDKTPRQFIITNTKFTYNAKAYAKCAGLEVLAWNYPENHNLYNFILESGVHPITAVSSIPHKAIQDFVFRKIVSCRDLLDNQQYELRENKLIPKHKINTILEEIKDICDFSEKESKRLGL